MRGAGNFLSLLSPEALACGVITYSSGNHAQAVAMAARLKGARAVVVMPTTAPRVKVDGAKRLGAEVVFEGTTSLQRKARAEAIAAAEGLTMVPPFDHAYIIAGQGTAGMEVAREWPEVEVVLAPIGGGGLASGVGAAVKRILPSARVIGVEPRGAAGMRAALAAGAPVTLPRVETIADGLMPVRSGDLTFEHARAFLDDVVLVDDDAIRRAASLLLTRMKLVVEYSGAATVGALISGSVDARGRKVAAVLSGGNLDPGLLTELALLTSGTREAGAGGGAR
jgi:threonine dehydratase